MSPTIKIHTAFTKDFKTHPITIDFSKSAGFSGPRLLGNVSQLCMSSIERAFVALENLGLQRPTQKILINFSCLTSPHEKIVGPHLDLALVVGLYGILKQKMLVTDKTLVIGEIDLTGDLKPVKNLLGYFLTAVRHNFIEIIIPSANHLEAQRLKQFNFFKDLSIRMASDVVGFMTDELTDVYANEIASTAQVNPKDFYDMRLSSELKQVAEVIAVGGHSLLMVGSPGSGKTMFAERLSSILPPISDSEYFDLVSNRYAATDSFSADAIFSPWTFRSPHHQASSAAILGGKDHPGEIALAHGGILFLDEFPEFRRDVIEGLREPLESGIIHVARAKYRTQFHCRIVFIAAANPCPCGWYGSDLRLCHCVPQKLISYQGKISNPIKDRIDIHLNMQKPPAEPNARIDLHRIEAAMAFAQARNNNFGVHLNAQAQPKEMTRWLGLSPDADLVLEKLEKKFYTARSRLRTLKLARTLADLDLSVQVGVEHLRRARYLNKSKMNTYVN